MKKVLVLYAHPRPDLSQVNKVLFADLKDLANVTAVDLYGEYSNFDINVEKEKKRLIEHDVLVFQHPIYWYSCPALLKDWMDLVLEYNFAHGPQGSALKDKTFVSVVSSGGSRKSYSSEGKNTHTIKNFLLPFEASFKFCHMETLPPLIFYSASKSKNSDEFENHKTMYHNLLEDLKTNRISAEKSFGFENLNDYYKSKAQEKTQQEKTQQQKAQQEKTQQQKTQQQKAQQEKTQQQKTQQKKHSNKKHSNKKHNKKKHSNKKHSKKKHGNKKHSKKRHSKKRHRVRNEKWIFSKRAFYIF